MVGAMWIRQADFYLIRVQATHHRGKYLNTRIFTLLQNEFEIISNVVAKRTAKTRVTHSPESRQDHSVFVEMKGLLNSRWLNKILSAIEHALETTPKFAEGNGG